MAVNLSRTAALAQTTDLAQAGATFNDAQRLLDGGLWSTPADSANQQAYLGQFTTDVHAVLNDVTADIALGAGGTITVGGTNYTLTAADITALTDVQTQLNTMLTDAAHAVGNSPANIAAQQGLHAADAAILSDINGDTGLATALGNASYLNPGTGSTDHGFQNLPTGSDSAAALSAATAPGATLAQIGAVFNAANDLAVGGLNHSNLGEFSADMKAVATGVQNILNSPTALAQIEAGETSTAASLTTLQLERVENQVQLQVNTFDKEYATNPTEAARGTNDLMLDVIDIINGDAALSKAAGGTGAPSATGGFAEMAGFLTGTTMPFQDSQGQTNFVAQFIAEGNTINNELQAVANGTSHMSISSLITQIQNFNSFDQSFSSQQGSVFQARFDNELLHGNILAATNSAVQALQAIENGATGSALAADQAQIKAAGMLFNGTAMDVGGNNVPIGGGTYVGTATTVAGATSVAGVAQGTTNVGPVANGQTGLTSTAPATTGFGGHGGFPGGGGVAGGPEPGGTPTPVEHHHWTWA